MSGKTGTRGNMAERSIKALKFMIDHNTFTIQDLSDHLAVDKKNGRKWLNDLSLVLPIIEVKPARYGSGFGLTAGLYRLDKSWVQKTLLK